MEKLDLEHWLYKGQKELTIKHLELYSQICEKIKAGHPVKFLIAQTNSGNYFICKILEQFHAWVEKYFVKYKDETENFFEYVRKNPGTCDGLIFGLTRPKLEKAKNSNLMEDKFDFILSREINLQIVDPSDIEIKDLSTYIVP